MSDQGRATVVFHSVVWQYLHEADQERLRNHVGRVGENATVGAPLAWLRMEPEEGAMVVRLTMWPGGRERLLALTGAHGQQVRWVL